METRVTPGQPTHEGADLLAGRDKYNVILDINNTIIANLGLKELFNSIATALCDALPVDCTAIALYEEANDSLSVVAIEPFASSVNVQTGFEMPRHGTHSGWVLEHRQTLIATDLEKEQRFEIDRMLLEQGIRSYIVLPLVSGDGVIGTFHIGSPSPDRYSEEDIDFADLVAKQLALAIDNARQHEEIHRLKERLARENFYLRDEIKLNHNFEELIGQSASLKEVLRNVEQVASTDATVLLLGETGTGKELLARAIHSLSSRSDRPLVKVNCATLPATLIESELFGHEKGAFTGATARKIGRFELADGGTLFLDEVAELPLELQPKLLRVLQEGEFERLGGTRTMTTNVRLIAATNRDIERLVTEAEFRADLYYRLNVFPLTSPPLRERRDDIPLLARSLVKRFAKKLGKRVETIPADVMASLQAYEWPGNVRELENVIERALILMPESTLDLEVVSLPHSVRVGNSAAPGSLESVEREHILRTLEVTNWQIGGAAGAADRLGLKPSTLRDRMRRLGLRRESAMEVGATRSRERSERPL